MQRRNFIKGMGAVALLPLLPPAAEAGEFVVEGTLTAYFDMPLPKAVERTYYLVQDAPPGVARAEMTVTMLGWGNFAELNKTLTVERAGITYHSMRVVRIDTLICEGNGQYIQNTERLA